MLNPTLTELLDCIYTLDDLIGDNYFDSDDYEKANDARNRAIEIINNLQEVLDMNNISML